MTVNNTIKNVLYVNMVFIYFWTDCDVVVLFDAILYTK